MITSFPPAVEDEKIPASVDKTQPLSDNVQSPVTKIETEPSAAVSDPGQTIETSKQVQMPPAIKIPDDIAKQLDIIQSEDVSSRFF